MANNDGLNVNKEGNIYVRNKDLYDEICKCKETGEMSTALCNMLMLISENCCKKMFYKNPQDREDCVAGAIEDCIFFWNKFNPEKSSNAFAYITSIAVNGAAKTWRKLGKMNFPDSIMTSLSNNVHTL